VHFASPIPWWLAVLVAAGIAGVAVLSYRRPLVPLSPAQRGALIALRALTLAAVALFVCRPVLLLPLSTSGDVVIPVLVDLSRSMRVDDADGEPRIARAAKVLQTTLIPGLAGYGTVEVLGIGDTLAPAAAERLNADARRTDLSGAIAAARDRYRGRSVPGIVVLSDGGDTGQALRADTPSDQGPPIYAIGVGSPDGLRDREVIGITAGDPRLDQTSIDLHVSAVARGFGTAPFALRVLANGQVLDSHRIVPVADGSPVDETFTVSPDPLNPTVYTAEIAVDPDESIGENNVRSVLVSPAGRKRRVLTLAGAPGFEHSFLIRALSQDPGLELDSVVRKGKNEEATDTFLVQAGSGRAAALTSGFPATREALFAYDAIVIANLEGDFFTRAQLALASDFVSERGGGLLALGGRTFEQRGLIGTPLEEALPVELNDRRGGAAKSSVTEEAPAPQNRLVLTAEGQSHPVMRIGATAEASRKLWASFPALAASAAVGGPRPGATVLAVTAAPSGVVLPVVAIQRYGRGRSMVFAGEASWRWRMLQPSTDRSYEFFWRQAARWLSSEAPDPVTVTVPNEAEPGDAMTLEIEARDRAFAPVPDATVTATLTAPGSDAKPLPLRPGGRGRFVTAATPGAAGLYRVHAEARRGTTALGAADRWFYVGGSDREFADPRLNEGFLRRLARESGGKYVRASEAARLVSDLRSTTPKNTETERRDLWHEPWAFALVIALLSAEWILRRRWGLR
jgi:uncharacterized membrane protein